MRRPERLLLYIALPAIALLLIAAVLSLFPAQHAIKTAIDRVEDGLGLHRTLETLLSAVKDAETAQRGYLLTGEEAYLAPYQLGIERARDSYGRLAADPADADAARLAAIRRLMEEKFSELQRTIELARAARRNEAMAIVNSGEGERLMQALRGEAAQLDAAERAELARRRAVLADAHRQALLRSSLAAFAAMGIAAALALFFFSRGRRTERRMRYAIDHMAEGFAILDSRFRIVEMNSAALRLEARPRAALIGQTHWQAYPGSEESELGRAFRRAMRDRVPVSLEHHYTWANGQSAWLEMRTYPLNDGSLAVFYRDISERKAYEENLRAEARHYAAAFDHAAIGMAEVALDGRWLRVNRTLCDLLGYACDELLRMRRQDVTHPDDVDADLAMRQSVIRGERDHYSFEKRYVRKDGSVVPVNLTIGVVSDAAGRPDYLIYGIEDISRRRAAEQEVRALNASLEQQVEERTRDLGIVNAQLEAFAYTVSHDLRAPLRAMEGFSRILLDDYSDRLDATGKRYADRIVAAARRMEALINDLLTFSRLQRAELRLSRIPLRPVLARAAAEAQANAAAGAAGEIRLEGEFPPVFADSAVLGQVLANLLSNALKFHKPGEKPDVCVHCETTQDRARLWVEDRGIGIAREHLAKVFGVFERLHGQEQYPGTGIGLAIVKAGVERMGGRVGVESEPGHGARFWIELRTVNRISGAHKEQANARP